MKNQTTTNSLTFEAQKTIDAFYSLTLEQRNEVSEMIKSAVAAAEAIVKAAYLNGGVIIKNTGTIAKF